MRKVIFITSIFLFLGLTSQAQSLTLGNCDSIPPDLYEQNLRSLSVSNGQGYCTSYDKTLDKRIARLKNLRELSFSNDGYYRVTRNQLPKQICKLKKLESLATSSIILEIFDLTQLKKLSLNLSADSAGYAVAKGFGMFQDLEELTLSFVRPPADYTLSGIAELPNLRRVTLYSPNQNVINEVLQNPNITRLDIQQARGKSLDFTMQKGLTSLTLSFNDLTEIPPSVYGLTQLDTLVLMYNKISVIPASIGLLKKLEYLDLYNNTIHTFAMEIGECSRLKWLRLDYNRSLGYLPLSLGYLSFLNELRASYCGLLGLPNTLTKCSILQVLELHHNQLESLNLNFTKLPDLKTLGLTHNKLKEIPASIYSLDSVTRLDLSDNKLVTLPDGIQQMGLLTSLTINNNELSELPAGVSELVKLSYLSVYNNAISEFPSVAKLVNLQTLYFGDNKLTEYPKGIENLKLLTTLEIQENKFSTFPEFVYDLQLLDRVWLEEDLKNKEGYLPEEKQPILLWQ